MTRHAAIPFAIYSLDTGQITVVGMSGSLDHLEHGEREAVYQGRLNRDLHKVDPGTGEACDKFVMALAPTATECLVDEEIVIAGVPTGALVGISAFPRTPCTDGTLEFSSDTPGTYRVHFAHPDYQPAMVAVTVTEAPE